MQQRSVDPTNPLDTIQLGLGAWAWGDRVVWQFGRGYGTPDIRKAFDAAVSGGIRLVDTAEVYGGGRSERFIGEFARELRAPILVATKFFPWPWRLTRRSVIKALRASLRRLGRDSVELYQIHNPLSLMSIEDLAEALVECVQAGLARTVGISNFDEAEMLRVFSTLARHGVPLAANQVHFSLLQRRPERNGLLARCRELGVRLIAYSPLEMGLLSGKYTRGRPLPGSRGMRYAGMISRIQPLLKIMTEIGQDQGGRSPSQVALNWVMAKGALPIPGAKNPEQAVENLGSLGWSLTDEQVAALDATSAPFP